MKGTEPMSNKRRQADYRQRLKDQDGQRTTVVLCPEAVQALERIQLMRKNLGIYPNTKKNVIEEALILYSARINES